MIPADESARHQAVSHLLKHFASQAQMAQSIGMTAPSVNNWFGIAFPLHARLDLLGVCLERGCRVDPEIVLGRDMVELIRQIAEASLEADARRQRRTDRAAA